MSHPSEKRLVVVLGMHRSGTSAITRSLELLGVRLGDNLHPASIDNPKGFWEDKEVLAINEELLASLGFGYASLGLVNQKILRNAEFEQIFARAKSLVIKKSESENTIWGFKDPRTARLLSFWQDVFKEVGYVADYVIATRNPISIVESLRKRDGFEPEKTFYLWLEHLIPAVVLTKGARRIVVDFDHMLENPRKEVLRMARALKLPDPATFELEDFEREFLEKELRHTIFSTQDLIDYPSVPKQVVTCYDLLVNLANDNVQLDDAEVIDAFDKLVQDLVGLLPALNILGRQDQQLAAAKSDQAQMKALGAALEEMRVSNAWLTSQREAWEKTATEREQIISALQAQVQEMQTGHAWLTEQRDSWEKQAKEHEAQLHASRGTLEEMRVGNAWLAEQRDAWEKQAKKHEQTVSELGIQLQEATRSLELKDVILNNIRKRLGMRFMNYLSKTKLF